MTDAEEFDRERIESLLHALQVKLQQRGLAATVYVVGGAAIVLRNVSDSRRTGDVDALMAPENVVKQLAAEVAAERSVRSNWLNSDARPWVPAPPEPLTPPDTPGLLIRTASDSHLLAMKIVAARGQRDMQDILALTQRMGITTREELQSVVLSAYGEDAIEYQHGGLEELALTCEMVERAIGSRNT